MIGIIDYGSGNIQAIRNIYKRLKIETFVIREPKDISIASKLILPGVGAFDEAIGRLNKSGLRDALDEAVLQFKVPVMVTSTYAFFSIGPCFVSCFRMFVV